MPLASLFPLQWYGPAMGAARASGAGAVVSLAVGTARAQSVTGGAGAVARAKATRLVNSPAVMAGAGATQFQSMKGRARAGALIRVNSITQDDVTGAVLESVIEGDLTLRESIRLLLAHAQGDATGLESSSIAFKSIDGSKTRIAGTLSAGNRTITSRDATP